MSPTAVLVSVLALGGCGSSLTGPLTGPDAEIVSQGADDISIRTWGWGRPDRVAAEHCRAHGKRAVFQSELRIGGEYTDKRLIFYDCVRSR